MSLRDLPSVDINTILVSRTQSPSINHDFTPMTPYPGPNDSEFSFPTSIPSLPGSLGPDDEELPLMTDNIVKEAEREIFEETGPKRTGSIFTALWNLTNGPIGAGMLSFPYTFYLTGVTVGIGLSLLVIVLAIFTIFILVDCSFETGGCNSFQKCMQTHLGTFWRRVAEFVLLIYGTGILVVYFLVIGQFVKPVVDLIAPGDHFYNNQRLITCFFAIVIIYPLLLLREIKALGYTSFISVIGSFYLVGFIVVNGILHVADKDLGPGQTDLAFFQTKLYLNFYPIVFLALPLKFTGYVNHVLMFPVSYEVKNGSSRKIKWIIVLSYAIVSCVYLSNGLFGWVAFGTDVQDNILNNFNGQSIPANIARFVVGLNLVFSLPIQHFSSRLAIMSFFWGEKKRSFGTCLHITVTSIYFLGNLLAALFAPGLSVLLAFVGASCCCIFMFFFPGLLAWKVMAERAKSACGRITWKILGVFLVVIFVFFAATGIAAATIDTVAQYLNLSVK